MADVIWGAIAQINKRGWAQNEFKDMLGRGCLNTALLDQAIDGRYYFAARRVITLAINEESLVLWNDEPGRTQKQVLAVLKIAARLPEAQREI